MFGFLKDKIKKAVKSISEKLEKKEEPKEEFQPQEQIQQQVLEKPVEVKEEVKIEEPVVEKIEVKEEIREEKIEQTVDEKNIEQLKEGVVPGVEPETAIRKEEIKPAIEKTEEKIETVIEVAKPKEKKGFFKRIVEKVVKPVVKKVVEKKLSEEDVTPILSELENGMIESDVAYDVAEKIKNDLKNSLVDQPIRRGKENEIVVSSLRNSLLGILSVPKVDLEEIIKNVTKEKRPAVFLFFGVNGVGKSLNLSKVAKWLANKNYRPILAAGDTYRAAGDLQLEMYASKINLPVIKHKTGADSAAVIYDAISAAKARNYDVVLGDTSGRMHTKKDLLDELVKIVRVSKPDLKIIVLDSLTGSDVIPQFEFFDKAVGVDAIIFTKNEINEKGGNILSVCHLFKKPILFLGTGQNFEDLMEYNPEKFVDSLLSQ